MRVEHYSRQNVPPGVVPLELLSPRDLIALGLDPVAIYRMQDELTDMGLGLGISLKGILKGVAAPFKAVAKGMYAGGKFVATKAVPTIAKTALKVAPIALPVVGGAALLAKFGPTILRKAATILHKDPAQLTEADVQAAEQAAVAMQQIQVPQIAPPQVSIAPTAGAPDYTQPHSRSDVWDAAHGRWVPQTMAVEKKSGLDFNKIAALVARASQAVPQVQQAVESVREAVAPAAPSTSVTVTAPGGGDGGVQQAGVAAGMPGWVLPAAVGAVALLAFRGRS